MGEVILTSGRGWHARDLWILGVATRWMVYEINLYFLALPHAETAILRVTARVKQGGHDIPESIIRRRFTAGLHNSENAYKPKVDRWAKFDNVGDRPILIEQDRPFRET